MPALKQAHLVLRNGVYLDTAQREVTDILRLNGLKLQQLIENLLSFSAWQAKSEVLALSDFPMRALIIALGLILKARRQAVVTGPAHLLGSRAEVEVMRGDRAFVRLDGELWQALSDQPLAPHDTVTVDAIDGVVLRVSKDGGSK